MLESSIERKFGKIIHQLGGRSMKLTAPVIGWPDRTVLIDGVTIFIEFKKPGGRPSPHQKRWVKWLNENGFHAGIAYSVDEALELVELALLIG